MQWIILTMVFLGSALMVFNIIGFIRFTRSVKNDNSWTHNNGILYIPIVLLVMFLLGYLGIGFFGDPDILVAGILFGGSVFVFIMYLLLNGITRRIKENETLKAQLSAAEQNNKDKSAFLASMSHEMRTPMNVILGISEVALHNPDLNPETREQMEKIRQSGKHLLSMFNNILDMHEMEHGRVAIQTIEFSMKDMMKQVDAIIRTLCDNKGLDYEVTVDPELPEWFIGDDMLVKQVLLGILDNAVKYTDSLGKVSLSVEKAEMEEEDPAVRFRIADTGIGIDENFLPKIYDLFSKEDSSATNRYGGIGLGLAQVKSKVDILEGKIEVESKKNVGSTFTVTLPLKTSERKSVPESEAASGTGGGFEEVTLEGKRILIAEDMPENAEIVADLLELEGAESEHAENGLLALEKFEQSEENYYDAVLMDLRMPVLDGLEATRRIRQLDRHDAKTVPILALTANAFESDVQQSLDAGMDEHLAKPVDAERLYEALKDQIREASISVRH
ncbi:MAG: response regulator [Parasporobacterium sp.]|nr:response regulator [Parasporobacterium sp.]